MAAVNAQAITDTASDVRSAIYAACAAQNPEKFWFQEDFMNLGLVPNNDPSQLASHLNTLSGQGLVKNYQKDGRPCWKVVKKEDAERYNV
jgi:DNA-directed RNA polymerase III subunit RPC6